MIRYAVIYRLIRVGIARYSTNFIKGAFIPDCIATKTFWGLPMGAFEAVSIFIIICSTHIHWFLRC